MKLPENQSELVYFLLSNISRLDDEHFEALMDKLEQWKEGMKVRKKKKGLTKR